MLRLISSVITKLHQNIHTTSHNNFLTFLYCEMHDCPCNDPHPCFNGAQCINSDDLLDYTCVCPAEFTGRHCEALDPCNGHQCINGGMCIMVEGDQEAENSRKKRSISSPTASRQKRSDSCEVLFEHSGSVSLAQDHVIGTAAAADINTLLEFKLYICLLYTSPSPRD